MAGQQLPDRIHTILLLRMTKVHRHTYFQQEQDLEFLYYQLRRGSRVDGMHSLRGLEVRTLAHALYL